MKRVDRRSNLRQQIAEILGNGETNGRTAQHLRTHLIPGKSLIGGGMALLAIGPAPVGAIGLGDIELRSMLGEPLQAVVPVTLGQGEELNGDCVGVTRGQSELRAPAGVRVSAPSANQPGRYDIRISTAESLHEPMYEISLVVDCPRVTQFVHHYVLLFDLPGISDQSGREYANRETGLTNPPAAKPTMLPAAPDQKPNQPPGRKPAIAAGRSLAPTRDLIPAGSRYRVRDGDTLSTIAARVEGRPAGTIWRVANRIFVTNEHAFIKKNEDLIKLGSLIEIPAPTELAGLAKPPAAPETGISQPDVATGAPPETEIPDASAQASQPPVSAIPKPLAKNPDAQPASGSVPADTYITPEAIISGAVNLDPTAAARPQPGDVSNPASSGPFANQLPADNARASSTPDAAAPAASTARVAQTVSGRSSDTDTLAAIGIGIVLGLSLSLLILRERLTGAILDLFRAIRRRRPGIHQSAHSDRSAIDGMQSRADALLSDASEFLDTLAEDAFKTSDQFAANTALIPLGRPEEDTYIVEVQHATAEPTMRDVEAIPGTVAENQEPVADDPEIGIATDSNLLIPTDEDTGPEETTSEKTMSEETLIAHLFDEEYEKGGEVIDPTGESLIPMPGAVPSADASTFENPVINPTSDMPLHRQLTDVEPTAEMPPPGHEEVIDPTADMPIHQQLADIEPTAEMPPPGHEEVIDPTADMPIAGPIADRVADPVADPDAPTVQMAENQPESSPDYSSQIPQDAFGIDHETLERALSDDLESLDPEQMFQELDELDIAGDVQSEELISEVLEEKGFEALPVDDEALPVDDNDSSELTNTLAAAMALLDEEYEDEFTSSAILEGTAIRKSLDAQQTAELSSEADAEQENPGKSETG